MHEMHEKDGFRHLPSEENFIKVEESLRKRFKVRERERFWEVKRLERSREIERNESEIANAPYIAS